MPAQRLVAVIASLLCSATVFAHHPFSEEFDTSKPITLTGTVTRIEWRNPHVYTHLDVKDDRGNVVNWKIEMGSPAALENAGWRQTSIKAGDQVTIKGWRARNDAHTANADSFTLKDGTTMAAASSFHDASTQMARNAPQNAGAAGTSGQASPNLPATASPLPVYAALGMVSLVTAFALRVLRQ